MGKIVDIKTGKESKNPNPFEYGPSIQYNYRSSRGLSNAPISESTGTGTMQLIKDDPDNTTYLNSLFPYTTSNLTINMGSDRLQVTMNKQDILGHFYATRWDIESGTDYDPESLLGPDPQAIADQHYPGLWGTYTGINLLDSSIGFTFTVYD